jgi:hypothetical protein
MGFICQHCGQKSATASGGGCSRSPSKNHVFIQEHAGGYVCQHCGQKSATATGGGCSRSPTKSHVFI